MVKIFDSSVRTIYVAGKMSGLRNYNYETFNMVARILRTAGYTVLNPAEFQGGYQDKSWHDYMRYDLGKILDEADALVLLPEWEGSKGANVEVTVARAIGIPVWDCGDIGVSVTNNPPANEWAVDHPDMPQCTCTPGAACVQCPTLTASGYTNGAYVYDEDMMGDKARELIEASEKSAAERTAAYSAVPEELTILEEAQRLVHGDRGQDYGHPAQDFGKTATMWSVLLGTTVTARQVALCMIAVKLSRLCKSTDHRDSVVDIAGYAETYSMVMQYEAESGPR